MIATQCVNFPTSNQNILDLVLGSNTQTVEYIHADEPVSTSDHSSLVYGVHSAGHVPWLNYIWVLIIQP